MDKNLDPKIIAAVDKEIERIRPIITAHGGGVQILKATSEELLLKLEGHCADCAMAPMTYGLVLEKYIREAIPSLKEIRYTK